MQCFVAAAFVLILATFEVGTAPCQDYPSKPVRIVSSGAGGPADFGARMVAGGLSGALGQPVIVDNRRGSVVISSMIVATAPPDGYTLIFRGNTFWVLPLMEKAPYDPVRDFAPISLVTRQPSIVVVHPSVPAKSIKELIAVAKAQPGQLNYGMAQVGSLSHLSAELFKSMAGVNIVCIAYNSTQGAVTDLVTNQIQMMVGNSQAVTPLMKSGRLRGLAVTSAQPSQFAPGMPTVAASGLPGYEAELIQGLFAPAKTPAQIINRLNQEMVRMLANPEIKDKFLASGVEAFSSSPAQLTATITSEMARMGKVIKDANIRAEGL